MGEPLVLSQRDAARVERMLRAFESNTDTRYQRRRRHGGSGGGVPVRRAFVKTAPGATTTLECFLAVDTTGTEIDVECDIYGGGNLNEAHPSFTDGLPLWVAYYDGAWRNVTTISAIDTECDT